MQDIPLCEEGNYHWSAVIMKRTLRKKIFSDGTATFGLPCAAECDSVGVVISKKPVIHDSNVMEL